LPFPFAGLVYAGIGWVVFRNKAALHEDLIFSTNYLGSAQPNITLNFSRGAANIVAQYYMFLRLGHGGYKAIMENLMKVRSRWKRLHTPPLVMSHAAQSLPPPLQLTRRLEKGISSFNIFRIISEQARAPLCPPALLELPGTALAHDPHLPGRSGAHCSPQSQLRGHKSLSGVIDPT